MLKGIFETDRRTKINDTLPINAGWREMRTDGRRTEGGWTDGRRTGRTEINNGASKLNDIKRVDRKRERERKKRERKRVKE